MAARYAYEYGKRWHVQTPRYSIGRFVDKQHVSMTDAALTTAVESAIDQSSDAAKYTPAIRRECVRYALIRHQRNIDLYRYVVGGR